LVWVAADACVREQTQGKQVCNEKETCSGKKQRESWNRAQRRRDEDVALYSILEKRARTSAARWAKGNLK
jgi:hypothetical protein